MLILGNRFGWNKRAAKPYFAEIDPSVLLPGDVIVTRGANKTVNWLIPGRYSHCLIYVGGGACVHAIPPTVCRQALSDIPYFAKEYRLLRHADYNTAEHAVARALEHLGQLYDYSFTRYPKSKAMYCTELVLAAYGLRVSQRTGRVVMPDELLSLFEEVG